MGMDYYIETKEEIEEEFEFPEGLSYFFEQIGGYGDTSMVSQVERILEIDLSLFQNISSYSEDDGEFDDEFDEDDDSEEYESEGPWLSVEDIQRLTRAFLTKISENPDYHKHVKYSGNLYPEDTGYLSTGEIVDDLSEFDKTLTKLKANNCLEIRLIYM